MRVWPWEADPPPISLRDLVQGIPVQSVHSVLSTLNTVVRSVLAADANDASLVRSTLLPPLITLAILYLSASLAIRALRTTIGIAVGVIKWGTLLFLVVGIWTWYVGEREALLADEGTVVVPKGGRRRTFGI